jgi:type IV secretion system protein VirB5
MGSAVVQARSWRLAAFGGLVLVLVSLVGLIYLGAQPRTVPHIVEVDKLGAARYRGAVAQAAGDFQPSEASLKYHLRRFIEATRTLSSDPALVKRNWLEAYTLLTPNAANQLTTFAQQNDPFRRIENERVGLDVIAMVPISRDTWQVDWRETAWDKSGNQTASAVWRGNFRIVIRMPENEDELARNPIGFYVDEFHWSRVLTSKRGEP